VQPRRSGDAGALHALGGRVGEPAGQRRGGRRRTGDGGDRDHRAEVPARPVGQFDGQPRLDVVPLVAEAEFGDGDEPVRRLRAEVGEDDRRRHRHVAGTQWREPAADAGAEHEVVARRRERAARRRSRGRRPDPADDHLGARSGREHGVPLRLDRTHHEQLHVDQPAEYGREPP
jgi:hypothetical protein